MTTTTLTRGQEVMNVLFNPGEPDNVATIKQLFADAYDRIDEFVARQTEKDVLPHAHTLIERANWLARQDDRKRLAANARMHLETAQMYAVKAVTR